MGDGREITRDKREDGMPVGKPFGVGNPGRPKGARSKLGEAFLQAMQKSFAEHGEETIETVRTEKPDQYLKVVASILPKEIEIGEEAAQAMVQVLFKGVQK